MGLCAGGSYWPPFVTQAGRWQNRPASKIVGTPVGIIDHLLARQMAGEPVILPIWHRLTMAEIAQRSPSLTNIYALNSYTDSVEEIARKVVVKVKSTAGPSTVPPPTPVRGKPT